MTTPRSVELASPTAIEVSRDKWEPSDALKKAYDREFIVWGKYRHEWLGARPLPLTVDKIKQIYALHSKHESIFHDHAKKTLEVFTWYVLNRMKMPIEVVRLPGNIHTGLMYVTDLEQSATQNLILNAFGHFSFWDGNFAGRRELVKEAIRIGAKAINLRRMTVRIPTHARGAIRAAAKLGFGGSLDTVLDDKTYKVAGRFTRSLQYQGEWYDEILMEKILEG